jgi:hypothetical protein
VLQWSLPEQVDLMEQLPPRDRAVVFRLLPRSVAFEAFGRLDASLQGELLPALRADEVQGLVAELDPDDRVRLLDELPAPVVRAQALTGRPGGGTAGYRPWCSSRPPSSRASSRASSSSSHVGRWRRRCGFGRIRDFRWAGMSSAISICRMTSSSSPSPT